MHEYTDICITFALFQLTATAPGRQQVRNQGAYLILRELHSWEPEPDVQVTCEKLIQVCRVCGEGAVAVFGVPASCSPASPAGRCSSGMSLSRAWKTCWRCRCLRVWRGSCSTWTSRSSTPRSSQRSWPQSHKQRGLHPPEALATHHQLQAQLYQPITSGLPDQTFLQPPAGLWVSLLRGCSLLKSIATLMPRVRCLG